MAGTRAEVHVFGSLSKNQLDAESAATEKVAAHRGAMMMAGEGGGEPAL